MVSAEAPLASDLGDATQPASEAAQIGDALLWLGHHSIDEFRLTLPPRDNAYYYFSRLLQLDPSKTAAQEGIRKVAAQYAFLAERETAQGRFDEARSYIRIGLQIDPNNQSLHLLSELTDKPKAGFWGALTSLFQ
jgi:tetratricopeptide (TPR) repeat protein